MHFNYITLNSDFDLPESVPCTHADITQYPDGQQSVCLRLNELNVKLPVIINCRIREFSDIELLLSLIAALMRHDFFIEEINFFYLMGMRSDRAFKEGEGNYFRFVIAPILNKLKMRKYIFFPHNRFVLNYLHAALYHPRWGYSFEEQFGIDISKYPLPFYLWGDASSDFMMQSLDLSYHLKGRFLGAFNKIREEGKIITALDEKTRERLRRCDLESPIIIMDDLCDGGGTFIAEAKYLRELGFKNPLQLWIAHGLFTKGLEPLLEYFEHIYCTNSYQEVIHPRVTQVKVI